MTFLKVGCEAPGFELKNQHQELINLSDFRNEKYGVWDLKKFMGREFFGIIRSTFIIDKTGLIAHIMPKVNTKTHHDDTLLWLRNNIK